MRCEAKCLFGHIRRYTVHLVQNAAGLDHSDPVFRVALPLTHSSLSRFLGDRLIGENSRPHLTATLHTAGDRNTRGFDLSTGDPPRLKRLETKFSKGNLAATIGLASHTPLHHFAKLNFLWC